MPKGYRAYVPDQDFLLPPSLSQWLPEGHLAYFVSDVVDQLDLTPMHAEYGEERRGQPPYDPRMMTKLLVYGYCVCFQFAQDTAAFARRYCFSSLGCRQQSGLSHHFRLSENPSEDSVGVLRGGLENRAGSRSDEAWSCRVGRNQDKGQRQQT